MIIHYSIVNGYDRIYTMEVSYPAPYKFNLFRCLGS